MMNLKEPNLRDGAQKTHPLGCENIIWTPISAPTQELNFYEEMNTFSKYGIMLRSYSRNNYFLFETSLNDFLLLNE